MLPALGRLEYDPRKPQPILDLCTFFRSRTVHLNIIKVFYLPTDAQEFCSKINININIKNATTCFGLITIIRERVI